MQNFKFRSYHFFQQFTQYRPYSSGLNLLSIILQASDLQVLNEYTGRLEQPPRDGVEQVGLVLPLDDGGYWREPGALDCHHTGFHVAGLVVFTGEKMGLVSN